MLHTPLSALKTYHLSVVGIVQGKRVVVPTFLVPATQKVPIELTPRMNVNTNVNINMNVNMNVNMNMNTNMNTNMNAKCEM